MSIFTTDHVTAAAAVAAVVLPIMLTHRRTTKRLDNIEHAMRNYRRDVRRLERFARRMARILFPDDPESPKRRWYERT